MGRESRRGAPNQERLPGTKMSEFCRSRPGEGSGSPLEGKVQGRGGGPGFWEPLTETCPGFEILTLGFILTQVVTVSFLIGMGLTSQSFRTG